MLLNEEVDSADKNVCTKCTVAELTGIWKVSWKVNRLYYGISGEKKNKHSEYFVKQPKECNLSIFDVFSFFFFHKSRSSNGPNFICQKL